MVPRVGVLIRDHSYETKHKLSVFSSIRLESDQVVSYRGDYTLIIRIPIQLLNGGAVLLLSWRILGIPQQ